MLKNSKISSFILFACLFLFGCAGTTSRSVIDISKTSKIKSIAVVSLLGNDFHAIKIGLTVFNNEYYESDVSGWSVDQFAEQEILKYLNYRQNFHGKTLTYEPNFRQEFLEKSKNPFKNQYLDVIDLAKKQGANTVIFVEPVTSSNSPLLKPGYGFVEQNKPPFSPIRSPYFAAIIRIISVDDGELLGWRWITSPGIDQSIKWKGRLENYSPDEIGQIRKTLLNGLGESLRTSLKEMGL